MVCKFPLREPNINQIDTNVNWNLEERKFQEAQCNAKSVSSAGEVEVEVIGVLVLDGAACLSGWLWVDAFSLDFSCLNWNVWRGSICL